MRTPTIVPVRRLGLAADALLISSGIFGILLAAGLGIAQLGLLPAVTGTEPSTTDNVIGAFAGVLLFGSGMVLGPLLTWRLYGRHFSWWAFLGGMLGAPAIVAGVATLAPVVASALAWLLQPFTDWEYAGPIALLTLVALGYLALLLVAVLAMIRQQVPLGTNGRLQRWRLNGLVALAVAAIVFAVAVLVSPDPEMAETYIYVMIIGFGAAAAVTGADVVNSWRSH